MRVMFINSFFSVGGPPRIIHGIYNTLVEQGDECLLAASREAPVPGMNIYRISNDFEVKSAALASRLQDNEGLSCKSATRKLVKRIEDYNPDVINLHNLHGYYINYEILFDYLKAAGKPVVWTLHDCWAFTGHCAHFSYEKCAQWRTHCAYESPCPQKRAYPASFGISNAKENFERKRVAFTDVSNLTIVTPSQWLGDLVGQSFLGCYPIEVIHNGIDLESFSSNEMDGGPWRFGNKKVVLGVAQNWAERKGFEDFVALSKALGDDYQIVMVGLTDSQFDSLPSSIYGIKRTNSVSELASLYSSADVFVNCTYQDNFPTVNIEALACGTPVLTYETGGSPEAVDETCGRVVPQGYVASMAEAVRGTISAPFSSSACVERAKKFDRKDRYADYRKLFESVMK